jgi:hypothetical protein
MRRTHSARAASASRPMTGSLPGRGWTLMPCILLNVLNLRIAAVTPPGAYGLANDDQGTPASVLWVLIHRFAAETAAVTWDWSSGGFCLTYLRGMANTVLGAPKSELQTCHSKAASDAGGRS